jgi:hypothetical protein
MMLKEYTKILNNINIRIIIIIVICQLYIYTMVCIICHEKIKHNYIRTICHHSFHIDCFINWIKIKHVCPICNIENITYCIKNNELIYEDNSSVESYDVKTYDSHDDNDNDNINDQNSIIDDNNNININNQNSIINDINININRNINHNHFIIKTLLIFVFILFFLSLFSIIILYIK